ncbi:uncharacterized protein KZ484_012845 [Pholidichthys leucotaenia]
MVFQRLLENQVFVKIEKCEFGTPCTTFLLFIISQNQTEPDPSKIKAITEWPTPTNRKQLQKFLRFANFYRWFINGYNAVVSPLTGVTSVKTPFAWSEEAKSVFHHLKELFFSAPVLAQADPSLPFVIEVDASDSGDGALLSQRSASDNKLCPCTFFSRHL